MSRTRAWSYSALFVLLTAAAQPALSQHTPLVGHDAMRHSDLRALADETEKLSDSFKSHLDRELDRTIIDGTKKEKQFEERASKLENALDDVRSSVVGGRKFKHTRDRVKRAVKYAQEMDRDLRRLPLSPMPRGPMARALE